MFPEYDAFDALGLARLIRTGEITPEEVLEAAIQRIETRNPRINAVIRTLYEEAREQVRRGLPQGPFTGAPFLLKDMITHYAGVPTGAGSALFREIIPERHSDLTRRYMAAGLVIVGKSNTPELALSGTTEPVANGPSRNPWGPAFSTGGSSGGSAAAVAARMVPMGHGSDTGGSIRNPASNCGCFGLKPSRGRVPVGPDLSDADNGLTVVHAVTRTIRDSAALLDIAAGPAADATRLPTPARSFLDEVGRPPGTLKIAVHTEAHHGVPIHPECVRAVEETVRLCEDLGHIVVTDKPDADGELAMEISQVLWPVGVRQEVMAAYRKLGRKADGSGLEWITWELALEGERYSAADAEQAVWKLRRMARRIESFFVDHDIVLSPVLSRPPWPLDTYEKAYADTRGYIETVYGHSPFCWPYNLSGQPAMSVPLHWTADGLPVGIMFAGRYGAEDTLLRLASQLEATEPWSQGLMPDGT